MHIYVTVKSKAIGVFANNILNTSSAECRPSFFDVEKNNRSQVVIRAINSDWQSIATLRASWSRSALNYVMLALILQTQKIYLKGYMRCFENVFGVPQWYRYGANLSIICVTGNKKDLTNLPVVTHICISESGQHWLREWLVAYSAPSHCLNQCWIIVNWTLRNKRQWNLNLNKQISIHENVPEISSAKWGPFCLGRDALINIHSAQNWKN